MSIESDSQTLELLPLIPLRGQVIFPYASRSLFIGRVYSKKNVEKLIERKDKRLFFVTQVDPKCDEPEREDLHDIGTIAKLVQFHALPDETLRILVEGVQTAQLEDLEMVEGSMEARVSALPITLTPDEIIDLKPHTQHLKKKLQELLKNNQNAPKDHEEIESTNDPLKLLYFAISVLKLDKDENIALLEEQDVTQRFLRVLAHIDGKINQTEVKRWARKQALKNMERSNKEYFLNEQMKAIQRELGDRDESKDEQDELEDRLKEKDLPDEARDKVERELKKLKMMSPMSAEATVVRNYIDWILNLPWRDYSEEKKDLNKSEEILDADHYALKKPKERILEYLAVHSLIDQLKGPILCLVGPPGVGKTSLARSIARSTGREFVRMSLGGVRDEAEIRGHRRTYIGAMPGKIIQSLKKVGTNNPVILLDEIDKMSTDFRGDPSSALLEVLDPEQNSTFNDHYVDLDYDLSQVMFITTANNRHQIPLPLQDRLEMIEVSGYTEVEKLQIIRRHLLPRQMERHGIHDTQIDWLDTALKLVINRYTRESGVRTLERTFAALCRKIAREVVKFRDEGGEIESFKYRVDVKKVQTLLGPPPYKYGTSDAEDEIGLVNGLAYTSWGGNLLPAECTVMGGKGKLTITGQLGDVMQESAQAAMSYVRSRAADLGLEPNFYQEIDIHVHFPEGAIPKDGPSAGVTMATALVSAFKRMNVRRDVAMTGEITLRGRVLPIGGLKEKLLAAKRGGIKTVFIPQENVKDLHEVPKSITRALEIIHVEQVDEIWEKALLHDGKLWATQKTKKASTTVESAPKKTRRSTSKAKSTKVTSKTVSKKTK